MEFYTVDDNDVILTFILRNPVLFMEFVEYVDNYYDDEEFPVDKSFKHFSYQADFLCDFNQYVSLRASRSAGKTTSLKSKIAWLLLNGAYGKGSILFTVPSLTHLEPVWDALVKLLRTNKFASQFLTGKIRGINSSSHTIDLKTPTRFIARIAGVDGGGRNVIGLHVQAVLIDEAGFYPWSTFMELQPVLNRQDPGNQMIVAGTPSGEREKNVLYFADQIADMYSRHRINAFQNPFYTQKDHEEDIKKYGGKDSPDYIHFVLGEHGSPVFSLFDRNMMKIEKYPVYKLVVNLAKKDVDKQVLFNKIKMLPATNNNFRTFFGIDLGFSDPTAIYIIQDTGDAFRIFAKIKLLRVPYPDQKTVLKMLDDKYNPDWIAIDVGGAGLNFYQELLEEKNREYKKRVIPVNFASSIVVGYNEDGKDMKQNVKEISVNYLQQIVSDGLITFSSTDIETVEDLERLTYTKTSSGRYVYRMAGRSQNKQEDHFISALLCFSYGHYIKTSGLKNPHKGGTARSLFLARMV